MKAIRPISELGARVQEAGRIRSGIKTGAKGAPKALTTWRFTSPHQDLIEALAERYGGEARPWSEAKAAAQHQWEVVTEAKSVRVYVPPGGLTQGYELWSGARCERRCNGVTAEVPSRGPDGIAEVDCLCVREQDLQCKPVTRLSVVLPDIPFRGTWRLETKSWNAADELNAMERMIDSLQETRDIVAADLILEQRSRMTPQGKRNFVVPTLALTASVEALAAGTAGLALAASTDALLELEAGDIEGSRPTSVPAPVSSHDEILPRPGDPDHVALIGETDDDDDVAEATIVYEPEEIRAEAERLANDLVLDPVAFRTGVCMGASDGVKVDETLLDDDERARAMDFLADVAHDRIEVVGIRPNHRLQIKRR